MSVLIPNMDKPKSCGPLKGVTSEFCIFVSDESCDCILQDDYWNTWDEQYQHCPLIEVKEGGDT